MIKFSVQKKSARSRARLGFLETPHGTIETPAFVPVATQAVIKTLTSEEALQAGGQILIANTFHLHLKPGEDVIKQAGGLHEFMNYKNPLMTDSGGFQVFSLGFGRDHGVGKILKGKRAEQVTLGAQPSNIKISDAGVIFKSPVDGTEIFFDPKVSIAIQEKLGADIIFAFDEATSPVADEAYTKQSLQRTHRWAQESLASKSSNQALFGIIQGGKFEHLRKQSAETIGQLNFDGFGIGGEYGDDKAALISIIETVIRELPENKPRHLLGIGHLEDIPNIIKAGVDTFDCIVPTHYARHGTAFVSPAGEHLDLTKKSFLTDQQPLDPACACFVCGTPRSRDSGTLRGQYYSRAYISHLVRAKEITGLKLLTFHNLYFFNSYVAQLRQQIKTDNL